jgi:hypothetical protein
LFTSALHISPVRILAPYLLSILILCFYLTSYFHPYFQSSFPTETLYSCIPSYLSHTCYMISPSHCHPNPYGEGPNFAVEWLTFLLRIREVPGSNLGPETGYPWFFTVPPGNFRYSALKLNHYHFLPSPFHFMIHLTPFHSKLCSLSC